MRILGLKGTKDGFLWSVVDVLEDQTAVLIHQGEATAPSGDRGEQVSWARAELRETLDEYTPDEICLRVAEAGRSISKAILERAEIEGALQSVAFETKVRCTRVYSATLRAKFKKGPDGDVNDQVLATPAGRDSKKKYLDATSAALIRAVQS